jgi:hypothetical protein
LRNKNNNRFTSCRQDAQSRLKTIIYLYNDDHSNLADSKIKIIKKSIESIYADSVTSFPKFCFNYHSNLKINNFIIPKFENGIPKYDEYQCNF